MAKYQLPPLKDEKEFEEFVCDLFNIIENTDSYQNIDFQLFGVKGQNQKGIDIISSKAETLIQCKLKDLRKKDEFIRKSLIEDIQNDISKVKYATINFNRFIFVSTFRDDTIIQTYVNKLKKENTLNFDLYYWGWDTLSRYAEENEDILKKYFPNFFPKRQIKPKIELPEEALGRNLLKKNYVNYLIRRYGDWKQIELDNKGEKVNWASLNKHIANKYKANGINYIHIKYFEDIVNYLQNRIDKTTFGRNNKSKGRRNYSLFEEHTEGIID